MMLWCSRLTVWLGCVALAMPPAAHCAEDAELLGLVATAARTSDAPRGSTTQLLGDFYRAYVDEPQINARGLAPLAEDLARIDAIRTPADVARHIGAAPRSGVPGPLRLRVAPDPQTPTRYSATLEQGGLTLPGREYYLSPEMEYAAHRAHLLRYIEQLLARSGHAEAASAALRIESLETRLANYHAVATTSGTSPGALAVAGPRERLGVAQLQTLAAGMDWYQYFSGAELAPTDVYVSEPTFVFGLGLLVRTVPVADWQAYFKFRLLDHYAPHLPRPLAELHAEFYARLPAAGPVLPKPLRALRAIEQALGPVLSAEYAARRLSVEAQSNAEQLADDVVVACEAGVQRATWLSDVTRERLRARLANLALLVGAPVVTHDFAALDVSATDLIGNLRRASQFEFARQARRIGASIDPQAWVVPAYSASAFYRAERHELIVPAGALDPAALAGPAATARNYSSNGVVIARAIYTALASGEDALAPLESDFIATVQQAAAAASALEALEGRPPAPK